MTTILVVDDDQLMRRSVSIGLENAGYSTETAGSGEEALAKARVVQPQLVLLDIGLPGMDGLETLRALQQALDAPVIFVTARRRELDEIVGLELGADDYVTKPFDIDVLLARVKAVLRRAAVSGERGDEADPPVFSSAIWSWIALHIRSLSADALWHSRPGSSSYLPIWRAGRVKPSRSPTLWRMFGGGSGLAKRRRYMCTFAGCAQRSRKMRPGPAVFIRCGGWATG